jgi:hypothetical protein
VGDRPDLGRERLGERLEVRVGARAAERVIESAQVAQIGFDIKSPVPGLAHVLDGPPDGGVPRLLAVETGQVVFAPLGHALRHGTGESGRETFALEVVRVLRQRRLGRGLEPGAGNRFALLCRR